MRLESIITCSMRSATAKCRLPPAPSASLRYTSLMMSLREPTAPMVKEAAAAGFFDTPFGKFPRLQIATVSDVLAGKLPKLPPQEKGGGYKQAGLEEMAKQYKLI